MRVPSCAALFVGAASPVQTSDVLTVESAMSNDFESTKPEELTDVIGFHLHV
jgi:hypothetical protein